MTVIRNAKAYIERFLKIRDKEGRLIPFRMNAPQKRLYDAIARAYAEGRPVRIIILKARQMGFSTMTEAVIFFLTVTHFYKESLIVAHTDEATGKLFAMSRRFYDNLPDEIKPRRRASNARELVFDRSAKDGPDVVGLGSSIRCATAGGSGIGRSYTLGALHLSEFAFWPGDKLETFSGLMQAVPDKPGTVVVIESTANGYDEFKRLWDAAVSAKQTGAEGFEPLFFPWYDMDEYRRPVPPGFEKTVEEARIAEAYGLDDEQIAWRRWCIATNCAGDVSKFKQEYPATPDEAFISTGDCVFDAEAVVLRRKTVEADAWIRGRFSIVKDAAGGIASFSFERSDDGFLRVRKMPEEGVPYVIGGDTAGTGSDSFVGQVLDNRTGEQVAVLQHTFGEREYAEQMFCLGKWYNEALIGVEVNYSTYPQLKLEELGYTNFFVRERYDTFSGKPEKAFGYLTSARTRPVMIDNLRDVARYDLDLITDFQTLGEMLTFVYDDNRRPAAQVGEHDDLVMALAIAHMIRSQAPTAKAASDGEKRVWTADMWEDYNRASDEVRAQLIKAWGIPKE